MTRIKQLAISITLKVVGFGLMAAGGLVDGIPRGWAFAMLAVGFVLVFVFTKVSYGIVNTNG